MNTLSLTLQISQLKQEVLTLSGYSKTFAYLCENQEDNIINVPSESLDLVFTDLSCRLDQLHNALDKLQLSIPDCLDYIDPYDQPQNQ